MISLKEAFLIVEENEVFELPTQNINVSLFPNEKKILFTQINKDKPNNKSRSIINQIKQQFDVQSVEIHEPYSFEIKLSPTSDFYTVVDFIKNEFDKNEF